MLFYLLIFLITFNIINVQGASTLPMVGGWHRSCNRELKAEMLNLARDKLQSMANLASEPIRESRLYLQIVAGTNLRLTFMVGEEHGCTLIAFKPLPYTNKPTEVSSFECAVKEPDSDVSSA